MPVVITSQDFYEAMPNYADCPTVMVDAHIETVATKDECLDSNYTENAIKLIKYYYIALMCSATAGGQKLVKSQRAPNGASQSFDYYNPSDRLTLKNALSSLDTANCVTPMIPGNTFSVGVAGRRGAKSSSSSGRNWRFC